AVFAWIFSGVIAASLLTFPRELWKYVRPRLAAIAILAFCLGAAPLISYNIRYSLATFRSNASWSAAQLPYKWKNLAGGLSGASLFGYLTSPSPPRRPPDSLSAVERASVWTSDRAGHPAAGYFGYALLAALLLAPARKPARFAVVAMSVA